MQPELQRQKALAANAANTKKRRKRLEWERHLVFAKTGGRCFYCWDELDFIWDFVCDHYIPLAKGGADDHSNLVPACYFCDNRKRSFLPTALLCQALKNWKHGNIVPRNFIDLPSPIPEEKLDRGARAQHRRSRKVIKQSSEKLTGFIPNPVIPWHILGDHTKHFYGERRTDQSTEGGTETGSTPVPGSVAEGRLHESGPLHVPGSTDKPGDNGGREPT